MRERKEAESGRTRSSSDANEPIPLDPVNLIAGIAPGLELVADDVPAGIMPTVTDPEAATVTVQELGKMLRMGESTIRRLIRTAILRPVEVDGQIRIRKIDVDRYLGLVPPDKPQG